MRNFTKTNLIVMFFVLLGFTVQSCTATQSVTNKIGNKELSSNLKGTWYLTSIQGTKTSKAFKGDTPTINFNFNTHRVNGNSGCNQYNGGFALIGNIFTPTPMASTLMACAQKNQEDKYLELLGKKSTLIFNDNILQFIQNGKVVLEFTSKSM